MFVRDTMPDYRALQIDCTAIVILVFNFRRIYAGKVRNYLYYDCFGSYSRYCGQRRNFTCALTGVKSLMSAV